MQSSRSNVRTWQRREKDSQKLRRGLIRTIHSLYTLCKTGKRIQEEYEYLLEPTATKTPVVLNMYNESSY